MLIYKSLDVLTYNFQYVQLFNSTKNDNLELKSIKWNELNKYKWTWGI